MAPKHYLEFLARLPNAHGPHTSETLLDHLEGTYAILERWSAADHVCAAGLFHSVYGTNAYHRVTLDQASRSVLRELIGDEAETLVHAFHLADWGTILRDTGCAARTAEASPGLFEIAIANLIEQMPRLASSMQDQTALYRAARAHLALDPWLSEPARCELRQLVAQSTPRSSDARQQKCAATAPPENRGNP